jgi:hypothetical protein
MRFKNNVIDRLAQVESTLKKIQIQLNRGASGNDISETVDNIVAQVESVRELIFTENDDFDQQFRG